MNASTGRSRSSEVEPSFASRIRKSGDPTVVPEPVPIENDLLDIRLDGPLGECLADGPSACLVASRRGPSQALHHARGRDQGTTTFVVDDLRVNVPSTAEDAEARPFGSTKYLLPDVLLPPMATGVTWIRLAHDFLRP
jgi:hypothetical protein